MSLSDKLEYYFFIACSIVILLIGILISIKLPTLSNIGGALISIGLVSFLFEILAAKRMGNKISSDIMHKLNLSLENFYQNISDIGSTLENEIKDHSEIWVAWYTGSGKGIDFVEYCFRKNEIRVAPL